jgi:hypothetical protein
MNATGRFEAAILAAFVRLPGVLPAVYRPKAGGEVGTYAQVENRQTETEARVRGEFAEIRVPARDVPDPAVDDVVEVAGVVWQMRPSTDQFIQRRQDGPFWVVRCRTGLRATLAGGR